MRPIIEESIIEVLKSANKPLSFSEITIAVKGSKDLKNYQSVTRACKNLEKNGKIKIWQLWNYTENKKTNYAGYISDCTIAVFDSIKKEYLYITENGIDDNFTLLDDFANIETNIQISANGISDYLAEIYTLKNKLKNAENEIAKLKNTDKEKSNTLGDLVDCTNKVFTCISKIPFAEYADNPNMYNAVKKMKAQIVSSMRGIKEYVKNKA